MKYRAREAYQDDAVAGVYDRKRFATFKGMLTDRLEKSLIDTALKHAGIDPPASILDIPCGTGRLSIYLAGRGFEVCGTDLSPAMIGLLKKKLEKEILGDKITANVGDAERLPYPDSNFDASVSLRLLGHTPPDARKKILLELKRVTRKCLILAYYRRDCLQYMVRKHMRDKMGTEWHPVTFGQIDDELAAAGLEKIKYFPLFGNISETVAVVAKKAVNESSSGK